MGTRSAVKAWRQSVQRHLRNRMRRSAVKTYVRSAVEAIASDSPEGSAEAVTKAISTLDRAAQRGAIHRNSAARRKARLMRKYNLALTTTAAAEETAPKRKRATKKEKTPKAKGKPPKAQAKKRGSKTKK